MAHRATVNFLQESAALLSTSLPTTSAILGAQRDHLLELKDDDLRASAKERDALRRETCGACGNRMIPGWSCKVTQGSGSARRTKADVKAGTMSFADPERTVLYTCLRCYRRTSQLVKAKSPRQLRRSKATSKTSTAVSISDDDAAQLSKSANASSKRRAKARKQSGLQAMISKAKMQNHNTQSGFGLDLMDLMKTD